MTQLIILEDDKRDWLLRDKNIIRDRLLLYENDLLIGAIYYSQGRGKNKRTTFFTLNIDPAFNTEESKILAFQQNVEKNRKF